MSLPGHLSTPLHPSPLFCELALLDIVLLVSRRSSSRELRPRWLPITFLAQCSLRTRSCALHFMHLPATLLDAPPRGFINEGMRDMLTIQSMVQ